MHMVVAKYSYVCTLFKKSVYILMAAYFFVPAGSYGYMAAYSHGPVYIRSHVIL